MTFIKYSKGEVKETRNYPDTVCEYSNSEILNRFAKDVAMSKVCTRMRYIKHMPEEAIINISRRYGAKEVCDGLIRGSWAVELSDGRHLIVNKNASVADLW